MFLHNLLNVLVQIANKMELQKKLVLCISESPHYLDVQHTGQYAPQPLTCIREVFRSNPDHDTAKLTEVQPLSIKFWEAFNIPLNVSSSKVMDHVLQFYRLTANFLEKAVFRGFLLTLQANIGIIRVLLLNYYRSLSHPLQFSIPLLSQHSTVLQWEYWPSSIHHGTDITGLDHMCSGHRLSNADTLHGYWHYVT
jgi:hypothetical protein